MSGVNNLAKCRIKFKFKVHVYRFAATVVVGGVGWGVDGWGEGWGLRHKCIKKDSYQFLFIRGKYSFPDSPKILCLLQHSNLAANTEKCQLKQQISFSLMLIECQNFQSELVNILICLIKGGRFFFFSFSFYFKKHT